MEPASATAKRRGRLVIVLGLTTIYMLAEAVGGLLTNSLALLADAGHMLTDVLGLGMALFAIWIGQRAASPERTYGYYRTEILAALANAVVLFSISGYILYEAWRRFQEPPSVDSLPMLAVATVGLVVNLIGVGLLRGASGESLNVQGAFLEVVSDLLGSVGVIAASLIIYFTGWVYADTLFSVGIGLFIIPRTWRLLNEAVGILLEGTPSHISVVDVRAAMEAAPGVDSVHDLHVWTITSGYVAMSAHVRLDRRALGTEVLAALNKLLKERFQIEHTTIQVEASAYEEARAHA